MRDSRQNIPIRKVIILVFMAVMVISIGSIGYMVLIVGFLPPSRRLKVLLQK